MKTNKTLSIVMIVAVAFFTSCQDDVSKEMPNNLNANRLKNQTTPPPAKSAIPNYTFTGKESDPIELETAKTWTANYRKQNPGDREGHFFGFEIIKQILSQKGCMGIRAYYAIDANGNKQLLLVATDANGEDLMLESANSAARTEEGNIVADASYPCPGYCNH
jgi:hypothetical protein